MSKPTISELISVFKNSEAHINAIALPMALHIAFNHDVADAHFVDSDIESIDAIRQRAEKDIYNHAAGQK